MRGWSRIVHCVVIRVLLTGKLVLRGLERGGLLRKVGEGLCCVFFEIALLILRNIVVSMRLLVTVFSP